MLHGAGHYEWCPCANQSALPPRTQSTCRVEIDSFPDKHGGRNFFAVDGVVIDPLSSNGHV